MAWNRGDDSNPASRTTGYRIQTCARLTTNFQELVFSWQWVQDRSDIFNDTH